MTFHRREFLAGSTLMAAAAAVTGSGSGGGGVAAAAPPPSNDDPVKLPTVDAPSEKQKGTPPHPRSPQHRLGYAVVGLGHIALEQVLPAFGQSKRAKLTAIVSGDPKKAAQIAAQHGLPTTAIYDYKTYEKLADNPDVQAVYIALPNHLHAEYTTHAAAMKKHVLCEKPMATSVADGQKMVDACKAAGVQLMIAYRIQYEPHHRFVQKLIRSKALGAIKIIEGFNGQNMSNDLTQYRLKKGGGALPDVGIYCLNTARFYLGEEPTWVQAVQHQTPGDVRFKEVDETMLWHMGWPSGTVGTFAASFATHQSRRIRAYGDKGGWVGADPAFGYEGIEVQVNRVRDNEEVLEKPSIGPKQQFAAELDHFAGCVLDGHRPYTPGEEGLQDLKVMEAIYQSAREGKRVDLPAVKGLDAFRGPAPADS